MSSQARETLLTELDQSADAIESFVALTAACSQLSAAYQLDVPEDGLFSLSTSDMTLVFFECKVWQDSQKMQPFLEKAEDSGFCFVCTGSDAEIHALPLTLELAHFRSLSLPIRPQQFFSTINNLCRLQSLMIKADKANKNVKETNDNVKYVLRVSRELNGVRDTKKLLSLILQKAREIANADAGSIYTVEWNEQRESDSRIVFKVTQNETVHQELEEFSIKVNDQSIVGSAVVHQQSINIPDLYQLNADPKLNPFQVRHDKTFDLRTGYQCRSMLTIPMFDISYRVIGVIQLINRRLPGTKTLRSVSDFTKSVTEFSPIDIEYAEIVAQQAGIALENALLTLEKEQLFDGFVNAAVTAIEQRDPTTSGHSHRVAKLTLGLAEIINRIDHGRFKETYFDKRQLKEIEYASLLHDFGKLGVREQVLTKAKKLYPWEYDILMERFEHIRSRFEIEYLREYIDFLTGKVTVAPGFGAETYRATYESRLSELDDFLIFIQKCNEPTVLEQGGFERLKDIGNLSFKDSRTRVRPFLSGRELEALSVSRGSLTREEFSEIQSHVVHTYEFLRKIPWGRSFPNVPQIAAKHHEKLDGTGYPKGSFDVEIPTQTRLMTIADIFDALTASDRPYKKAVPVEKALDILQMEVKVHKIDKDLFDLFVESKVYNSVLEKQTLELNNHHIPFIGTDMTMMLTPDLLISAYANGYFPMPHPETEEICWFHPDPRAVIPLDHFHVSRTLRRTMRRKDFRISINEDFEGVIDACADRAETWINDEIRTAFVELHHLGHSHSVEVWSGAILVGGTYGLAIRGAFFAESMFHRETDASKVALWGLVNHLKTRGMTLLEVQFLTPHLQSLGAVEIPSADYLKLLHAALKQPVSFKERKLIQSF